ncbi:MULTISPECIES: MBL fold metallo-hydrolase [Paenibacillus]|uniref:MBL fold metallo-hydrolase n=1 Tax=Paenibacillus lutrae TaxID=2078573 RepID=A0A7X3FJB4_9BACL|nr:MULTISPECIES: MBL fold metallo-hydrolase [Paenibacillus]MVP00731.1 MBL fold metallo-hydrolase [Paenibacillus lutrae]
MALRFTVLASGSTGNATVVSNGDTTILVDAGLSAKKVEQLMLEREVKGEDIDAILVTHEHSDHIKGLGAIARKYNLPVYANPKTWDALDKHIGKISETNRRLMATGTEEFFGDIRVESYGISHDAAEPVGYCFHCGGQKLAMATDLGYMSTKVKDVIGDSDAIILEANHDIEMLRMGHYPWNIKRRILSDLGHLSNEAAGEAILDIMTARTKAIYMAHLSQNHNLMDLARLTLNNVVEDRGVSLKERKVRLMDTYFDRPTKWEELGKD